MFYKVLQSVEERGSNAQERLMVEELLVLHTIMNTKPNFQEAERLALTQEQTAPWSHFVTISSAPLQPKAVSKALLAFFLR
jgi:hypothetical protein